MIGGNYDTICRSVLIPFPQQFRPGDEVFYMGSVIRQGGFADFHVVDAHLVAHKPRNLSFGHAAAVPLCFLTAWECFEKMGLLGESGSLPLLRSVPGKTILISPGAGGVGSVAIQIAKKVLGLRVVATASRPQSQKWCVELGADGVVNHGEPLLEQLEKLGIAGVDYILTGKLSDAVVLEQYLPAMKPMGYVFSSGKFDFIEGGFFVILDAVSLHCRTRTRFLVSSYSTQCW